MKKILILIIAFCLSACGVNSASNDKFEKYGEKVSYADGREMKFPDFSIKFTGKRSDQNDFLRFPRDERRKQTNRFVVERNGRHCAGDL